MRHVRPGPAVDDLQNWVSHEAGFGHVARYSIKLTRRLVPPKVSLSPHPRRIVQTTFTHEYAPTPLNANLIILSQGNRDGYDHGPSSGRGKRTRGTMRLYAYSQAGLRKTCNPSGYPTDGEPKFNVDGTPITGSWGRAQPSPSRDLHHLQDGPALRAITLIRFANYLLDCGNPADYDFASSFLYSADTSSGNSVIKNDLEFTSHNCFWPSVDLWEEIVDLHFFTLVSCRKALIVGSVLATRLGDSGAASWYTQQSSALTSPLLDSRFRFPDGSYRAYADASSHHRRGADSAVLLGILTAGEWGDPDFGPSSPAALASVKVYVDAFRGRYPGDKWDGYDNNEYTMGNPWYICAVAVPHLIDLALIEFVSAGKIEITDISPPFFKQFADVKTGTLSKGSNKYSTVLADMRNWSNGFYTILRQFQGPGGVLYEQFGRITGLPQGGLVV